MELPLIQKDNKGQGMYRCQKCNNKVDPTEIYSDWFYCIYCKKELTYRPKRSKREDDGYYIH